MAGHHIRGQGVYRTTYVYDGLTTQGAAGANFDCTKFFPAQVPSAVIIKKTSNVGATLVTLPYAAYRGTFVYVKDGLGDAGTNNITIQPAPNQPTNTVDGAANVVLKSGYGALMLMFDGTEWKLVGINTASATGNLTVPGLLIESTTNNVTAAGTTQGTATPTTTALVRVTTVPAGGGILLPGGNPATAGLSITVANAQAVNPLLVYPQGTDTINNLAAGVGYSLAVNLTAQFTSFAPGIWHAIKTA